MTEKLVGTNGTAGIGHNNGGPSFSAEQEAILRAGSDALAEVTEHKNAFIARRTFEFWKPVARAIQVLRDAAKADRRFKFVQLRERYGFGSLKKDRVSRLLKVIDNEAAVEAWRASLTEEQRRDWSSAEAIVKYCPDIPRKSKPEGAIRKRVTLREVLVDAMKKIEGLEEERDQHKREATAEFAEPAAAFTTLVSIGHSLELKDLPKDVKASDLLDLAERIRQLAADVEQLAAETVH